MATTNAPAPCDSCGKKRRLTKDKKTGLSFCKQCVEDQATQPPAPVQSSPRNEVDLTRSTPWGTEYRIARTATADVECDQRWVTVCLAHDTFHPSPTLRTACAAGTRGSVADWCDPCAKLRNAPPEPAPEPEPAPAKPPAKKPARRTRKAATA